MGLGGGLGLAFTQIGLGGGLGLAFTQIGLGGGLGLALPRYGIVVVGLNPQIGMGVGRGRAAYEL
jgi:hypothetical protein